MPTAKPRVNVVLDQSSFDLLTEFAASQGVSRSSVLAELWETASPVMARVLKMVREVQRAKDSVREGIRAAAIEAESKVLPLQHEALLNLDLFEEAIKDMLIASEGTQPGAVGSAHARTVADGDQVEKPPSSNTGVRFRKGRGVKQSRGG